MQNSKWKKWTAIKKCKEIIKLQYDLAIQKLTFCLVMELYFMNIWEITICCQNH